MKESEAKISKSTGSADLFGLAKWGLLFFLILASAVHLRIYWGYFGLNIFAYLTANDVIVVAAESVIPVALITGYIASFFWLHRYLPVVVRRRTAPMDDNGKSLKTFRLGITPEFVVVAISANLTILFIPVAADPRIFQYWSFLYYILYIAAAMAMYASARATHMGDVKLLGATSLLLVLYMQTMVSVTSARFIEKEMRYSYVIEESPRVTDRIPGKIFELKYLGKAGDWFFFLPTGAQADKGPIFIRKVSDMKELKLYFHKDPH